MRWLLYVGLHRPRGHDPSDAHVGSLSADSFSAIACSVTNALGRDVHFIPKVKDSWKSLHTLLNVAKSCVRGQRCVPQDRRLSTVIRLLTTVPPCTGALLLQRCHFPPWCGVLD